MVTTVVPRPYAAKRDSAAVDGVTSSSLRVNASQTTPGTSFRSQFAKRILKDQAPSGVTNALHAPTLKFETQELVVGAKRAKETTPSVGIIGAGASGLYAALILQVSTSHLGLP